MCIEQTKILMSKVNGHVVVHLGSSESTKRENHLDLPFHLDDHVQLERSSRKSQPRTKKIETHRITLKLRGPENEALLFINQIQSNRHIGGSHRIDVRQSSREIHNHYYIFRSSMIVST